MTDSRPVRPHATLERILERGLFASRWLMAPFYVGLVGALMAMLWVFFQELIHDIPRVPNMDAEGAIVMALSLIDLSLSANLLIIVIFSGYENFVSKIDIGDHADRPAWMGQVDFSGLKMKLIASIVAISAIALLKAFLSLTEPGAVLDQAKLMWLTVLHITFVISGVLLALMDWLTGQTRGH
jgi:uncharacterized protein (TIGR00645 family)